MTARYGTFKDVFDVVHVAAYVPLMHHWQLRCVASAVTEGRVEAPPARPPTCVWCAAGRVIW